MNAGRSAIVLSSLVLLAVGSGPAAEESRAAPFAALGISVSLKPPSAIGSNDAEVAYFVRPEPGESLDSALARGQLIATNESRGGRLFLLGATPGTYFVVAAAYLRSKSAAALPIASEHPARNVTVMVGFDPFGSEDAFRTYLPRAEIESTAVTVLPDSFVWAGDLDIKQVLGIAKGDDVQLRFQQALEGKAAKRGGFLRAMTGTYSYRGTLRDVKRDPEAEAKFLEKSWKHLRKTEWAPLLERRKATLQAALPAKP